MEVQLAEKLGVSRTPVREAIRKLELEGMAVTIPRRGAIVAGMTEKDMEEVKMRYFDAPDLKHVGKNGYRFVNAVSDFATHAKPLRETANYRENLFARTVDGNVLIDKAYSLMKAA